MKKYLSLSDFCQTWKISPIIKFCKKAIFLFLVFLSISIGSIAQNYYEVMIPDFCLPQEIYKQDTFLNVFVRNSNTGKPWYYRYSINGNYMYSKNIFDHNISYIIKNINDTAYVMTGCYSIDTITYKIIICFNQNLDTIWTQKDSTIYPNNSEYLSISILNNCIVTSYLTQNIDIPSSGQYYIRHFDYSGNIVYNSINSIPGHTYAYNDSTLLIIKSNPSGMTKYLKTDKCLNIIDSTTVNKAWDDYNYTTRINNNGEILAYSQGPYLLDANLSLMWTKPILDIYSGFNSSSGPYDIQFTNNGGYALAGLYHYDYHDMGFLFNLDENLTVINNNIYSYWYVFEWVHRIIPLDDGSFILLAAAQSQADRTWIYHTYQDGSVSTDKVPNQLQIQVFPNPVTNEVTVKFDEYVSGNIRINNIIGKQVWNSEFSDASHITIPTNQLESGVYVLMVSNGNNHFVSKFCKQ